MALKSLSPVSVFQVEDFHSLKEKRKLQAILDLENLCHKNHEKEKKRKGEEEEKWEGFSSLSSEKTGQGRE